MEFPIRKKKLKLSNYSKDIYWLMTSESDMVEEEKGVWAVNE